MVCRSRYFCHHLIKKKKRTMKKIYMAPAFEEIELELTSPLLNGSGGGIHDDNSSDKDDNPSEDPGGDFGW